MAQKLRFERNFCVCRLRLIFPARLQASIVSTAKLNFCVRNGNRWTLCVKITDSRTCWARFTSAISRGICQRRPIFPARLQASIVGTAKLNFCVRNGNRWTLCAKNTNFSESLILKIEQQSSLGYLVKPSQIRVTLV